MAIVGDTRKPSRPYRIARSKSCSNGSLPQRLCISTHADTQPGTLALCQPRCGIVFHAETKSGVHPAGERPDAFRPCSRLPSQMMAYASEPMPLETGSTRVSVIAVARIASTALPPAASICKPACAASGWVVATTLAASTGLRGQA